MDRTRTTILLSGIVLILGASALGYVLGDRVERAATPSPAASVEASPPASTALAPALSPAATPSPPPPPAIRGAAQVAPVTLTFEPVPATLASGTPLLVQWQIGGPAGTPGTATRLQAQLEDKTEVVSSDTSGPFALPARFAATVTPTGSALLRLHVEATVDGETLRAEQTLTVTN